MLGEYTEQMGQPGKIRRRPTATAILVGTVCFVISCACIFGPSIYVYFLLRSMSPALSHILLWVGPVALFPVVVLALWFTVVLMEWFEKSTGISLRTRSSRKSG